MSEWQKFQFTRTEELLDWIFKDRNTSRTWILNITRKNILGIFISHSESDLFEFIVFSNIQNVFVRWQSSMLFSFLFLLISTVNDLGQKPFSLLISVVTIHAQIRKIIIIRKDYYHLYVYFSLSLSHSRIEMRRVKSSVKWKYFIFTFNVNKWYKIVGEMLKCALDMYVCKCVQW